MGLYEDLMQRRKYDAVLDEQLTKVHDGIQKKYERERQAEFTVMYQEDGITEDEVNTGCDDSIVSCIFTYSNQTLDEAVNNLNQRLQNIIDRIDYLNKCKFSSFSFVRNEIAMGLYLIKTDKLYLASDYKSVFEVAKDVLGFARMTTTNYIKVAKRFIDKQRPVSIFYDGKSGIDFTISQLVALLRLTEDEIRYCMESGMLDICTPISAISEVVKIMLDKREQTKAQEHDRKIRDTMKPFQESYDSFHTAYNALKEHLTSTNDDVGANTLLPNIMDAVCAMYAEGLQHFTSE